jgi:hypothetical protein
LIANPEFQKQPKLFWAYVRTLSQRLGYTERAKGKRTKGPHGKGQIKLPTIDEMRKGLAELGLDPLKLVGSAGTPTKLGAELLKYFEYRASVLNGFVETQLMDASQARILFNKLRSSCRFECPMPMNKQKGKMAKPAYFTAIINMLIAAGIEGAACNYSPGELTTITKDGAAVRTLARRVDGAFPKVVNPVAVWEIKEYYYTTTFGSRIADGVYETLLDGMELEELREHEGIDVKHYLMVDAYDTWWKKGRSYLCRMIDMLHMCYVDEVLFGKEVVDRIPVITAEWLKLLK